MGISTLLMSFVQSGLASDGAVTIDLTWQLNMDLLAIT